MRRKAIRLAKVTLRAVGLQVSRIRRDDEPDFSTGFYPTQRSCQIPDIGFLVELFLGARTDGTFVEVGAYDGVTFSNTWGLAHRGWGGLLIEPLPDLAERCRVAHASHPGVRVLNVAIGSSGEREKELSIAGALTTGSREQVDEYRRVGWIDEERPVTTITVPCKTLDEVLTEAGIQPGFEVLVVDVEGQEAEVLSTLDLARWRPAMLVIEIADTHPELSLRRGSDFVLHTRLLSLGYWTAYKDRINTVLVRKEVAAGAYGTVGAEPR